MTDSISVGPGAVAKLIIEEGDGACVVVNRGPYTIYFGDNNAIRAADQSGVVPITINSYISVTGDKKLYACVLPGQVTVLDIISGAVNFFLPFSSLTIPYGSTGARVVINPPSDPGAIVGYDSLGHITFILDSTGFLVGPTTGPQILLSGGNPATITFPLNDSGFSTSLPVMFGQVFGAGVARYAAMILDSPTTKLAAHDDYVEIQLNSPNADGSSSANLEMAYVDTSAVSRPYFIEDYTGVIIQACSILKATDPATGTSITNPAVTEQWHAATLAAGWTGVVRFKKLAESNFAMVECAANNTGVTGNSTLVNSIPAAYQPLANKTFPICTTNTGGAPTTGSLRGAVNASGSITLGALPPTTTFVGFYAIYPLD